MALFGNKGGEFSHEILREGEDTIFGGAGSDTVFSAGDGFADTIGDGAGDTLDYDIGLDTLVQDPDDIG